MTTTTLTPDEIEGYVCKLTAPGFEPTQDNIAAAVGHLPPDDPVEIVHRAVAAKGAEAEAAIKDGETWDAFARLARAAGTPDKAPTLPWLAKRGLAKKVINGWMINAPGPDGRRKWLLLENRLIQKSRGAA